MGSVGQSQKTEQKIKVRKHGQELSYGTGQPLACLSVGRILSLMLTTMSITVPLPKSLFCDGVTLNAC